VPAAPVFLGVKQRNQSDDASDGKKESLEIAPAKKPPHKTNQSQDYQENTSHNDGADHAANPKINAEQLVLMADNQSSQQTGAC
jgi:hypothetical protein